MKKSRIAKFALLGASAAALAATLSTSTYAWYVSNKTANVNAVTGSTAAGSSDGSISLSTSGKVNEYYQSISLTAAANFNGVDSTVKLEPVTTTDGVSFVTPTATKDYAAATGTYQAGTKYYTRTGSSAPYTYNEVDTSSFTAETSVTSYYVETVTWATASASTKVYKFMFYIKSDSAVTVQPTITVRNKTTEVPTAINYSADGNITGAIQGQDFTIDAIHALHMSLVPTTGKKYEGDVTTFANATSNPVGATQLQAVEGGTGVNVVYSAAIDAYARKATAGAADYFTEIMGYAPYTDDIAYTENAFTTISLLANTPKKLEYYIWLDGGDDQCLNPCVSQNFEFEFSYTVTA